jgi:Icc-related predicted phosphoesterase
VDPAPNQDDERVYAVIGDVHAHMQHLEQVCTELVTQSLTAVLLVGDIGTPELGYQRNRTPQKDAAYLASVAQVLQRVRALGAPVLWVPGNHDLTTFPADAVFAGNIDGRVVSVGDVRIAGFGGAGPGFFGFPYEWSDEGAALRGVPACELLLAHAPPAHTALDRLWDGRRHVGSVYLRSWLASHTGAFACGHIHEAGGVALVDAAACVNAGGLGLPYGKPQVGYLRLQAGLWRAEHHHLTTGQRVHVQQT